MNPWSLVQALFGDYTLRTVALGAGTLGAVAGALGTFAVLRRQSLLGDAISHAALPGIVLAFIVTGSRELAVLVLGAAVAGWIGALCVQSITRSSRIPEDGALGIVLSVFFGMGLVLLTWVQRLPGASQAGLDRFLFGQAATMVTRDVVVIATLGLLAVVGLALVWKEVKILAFDRAFGISLGLPMARVDLILTSLLVLAIVAGLQAVGVILMSTLVVAPAVAARQWTDHLGRTVFLAAALGSLSGIIGAVISARVPGFPTGPTIVVVASAVVAVSILLAPRRGMIPAAIRSFRSRRRLRAEALLTDLRELDDQHPGEDHAHPTPVLRAMRGGAPGVDGALRSLAERGWAARTATGGWHITDLGRRRAEILDAERARGSSGEAGDP